MLYLKFILGKEVSGYWDGGSRKVFWFSIDHNFLNKTSKVGSFSANFWKIVKTGKTDKQTLSYIKPTLRLFARQHETTCTFEYVEE